MTLVIFDKTSKKFATNIYGIFNEFLKVPMNICIKKISYPGIEVSIACVENKLARHSNMNGTLVMSFGEQDSLMIVLQQFVFGSPSPSASDSSSAIFFGKMFNEIG